MNWLRGLIQFIPLTVFVSVFRITNDWTLAFQVGGATAILQAALLKILRQHSDLVLVGINLFLVIGALAFIAKVEPVLMVYSNFQEATLFLAIFLVALISTATLKRGFIDMQQLPRSEVVRASLFLIAAVVASIFIAIHWSGNLWLAGVLPMILIVVARKKIRQRFSANSKV